MLNWIFWKKVQGQKHPGRCGIVEHQIPSSKVLFKTNAKSHKHPGIKLFSSKSKTELVNQRKQNSYRRAYIYIYINTEFRDGTKVIRRKHIIQPTGIGACSTCCQWVERMCQRHGSDQTPTLLFESKNHVSINSYSRTYAVEEFLLSIIPNSANVWSLQ